MLPDWPLSARCRDNKSGGSNTLCKEFSRARGGDRTSRNVSFISQSAKAALDPFTATDDVTWKRWIKVWNLKALSLFWSSFSHWHVKARFSRNRTALKGDVIGPEKNTARLRIFEPGSFTGWGSEGVNSEQSQNLTSAWAELRCINS